MNQTISFPPPEFRVYPMKTIVWCYEKDALTVFENLVFLLVPGIKEVNGGPFIPKLGLGIAFVAVGKLNGQNSLLRRGRKEEKYRWRLRH